MTDLQRLANIAEILGALMLIGGAIFGILQIREFRAQRRQAVAVELTRSFHNLDLVRAMNLILKLPDGISAEELRSKGPEYEEAAIMISATYEAIALLVFRKMATFSMVRELTGGVAVVMWQKLEQWIAWMRQDLANPSWAEWFQWLAAQLARESTDKDAHRAYERFADWRPLD